METKQKKMKIMIPFLPSELIEEIMLRLPVKSLLRFRSVSKHWNSIISNDTHFAKSHFDLATTASNSNSDNKLLYIRGNPTYTRRFHWVDIDASIRRDCGRARLPTPNVWTIMMVGSCRGFILIEDFPDLIIWNPSTGTHRRIRFAPLALDVLKNNSFRHCFCWYGFGYDPSTDDYLIVVGWHGFSDISYTIRVKPHIEFFSVRSNSWKEINQDWRLIRNPNNNKGTYSETQTGDADDDAVINKEFPYMVIKFSKPAIFCNGALHWLAAITETPAQLQMPLVNVIIAFDLASKSFVEIPLPKGKRYGHFLSLFGESLGVFIRPVLSPTYEIWVMKEYKVQSSWTMIHVVNRVDFNYTLVYINKKGQFVATHDNRGDIVKLEIDDAQAIQVVENNEGNFPGMMFLFTESILSLPGEDLDQHSRRVKARKF